MLNKEENIKDSQKTREVRSTWGTEVTVERIADDYKVNIFTHTLYVCPKCGMEAYCETDRLYLLDRLGGLVCGKDFSPLQVKPITTKELKFPLLKGMSNQDPELDMGDVYTNREEEEKYGHRRAWHEKI